MGYMTNVTYCLWLRIRLYSKICYMYHMQVIYIETALNCMFSPRCSMDLNILLKSRTSIEFQISRLENIIKV